MHFVFIGIAHPFNRRQRNVVYAVLLVVCSSKEQSIEILQVKTLYEFAIFRDCQVSTTADWFNEASFRKRGRLFRPGGPQLFEILFEEGAVDDIEE